MVDTVYYLKTLVTKFLESFFKLFPHTIVLYQMSQRLLVMVFFTSTYPYRTSLLNSIEITQGHTYCFAVPEYIPKWRPAQHQMENFNIPNICHVICTTYFDKYRENMPNQSDGDRETGLQQNAIPLRICSSRLFLVF